MDLQEHVLRELFGPTAVRDAARDDREDQSLVLFDQLAKRRLIALPAPLDQHVLGGSRHSLSGALERAVTDFVSRDTETIWIRG